ncbi:MAG: SUMF1/EgtB/PvdO family nonheme iron enzyme [Ferruginibacter sp.]
MRYLLFSILLFMPGRILVPLQGEPKMVKIEGGTFMMGDDKGIGERDERPLHPVTLTNFSMAATEVTVLQWKNYCRLVKQVMPDAPEWGWKDDHPVVNVTWEEAVAYCKWLSERTGKKYRLPTEAEWEYAARGGKLSKGFTFSGGDNAGDVSWFAGNSNGSTHTVAQKRPNELGLYDMSGNAWEWCSDHLDEYKAEAVTNPTGSATSVFVIRRGGSWDDIVSRSRPTYRAGNSFRRSYHTLGFRVASSDE